MLDALGGAWRELTGEEALALRMKIADGAKQRAIARALRVPDYQVSRWIRRATEKLERAVNRAFQGRTADWGDPDRPAWDQLLFALSEQLAKPAPQGPPFPDDERTRNAGSA